jgi:hypothetical protein
MPHYQRAAKSIFGKISVSAGLALLVLTGAGFDPAPHTYYGKDDRQDVYQLAGQSLADSDSVVALFPESQVNDLGDGTAALLTGNYGDYYNLCPSERFRDQPIGSFCTGVLVAPDIIATAAHCLTDMHIADIRFIFGYQMRDQATPNLVINNLDIYTGVAVIASQLDRNTGSDWALIRLDRPVVNHHIARIREAGTVSDGNALFLIGHPMGLPSKFAGGGIVRENRYRAVFIENLDSYPGNSGSPVFNSATHVVEGLQVRGKKDSFVKQGACFVSRLCPDAGCSGGLTVRTTEFARFIPWLR